jgi:predicted PurR-regulated permease PerM
MTIVVSILFFGLAVSSKAEPSAIDQIKNIPGKIVGFIENEVAETKEYQKANKEEMKYQIKDTKEDLKDLFASIKGFFIKQ